MIGMICNAGTAEEQIMLITKPIGPYMPLCGGIRLSLGLPECYVVHLKFSS